MHYCIAVLCEFAYEKVLRQSDGVRVKVTLEKERESRYEAVVEVDMEARKMCG